MYSAQVYIFGAKLTKVLDIIIELVAYVRLNNKKPLAWRWKQVVVEQWIK